MSASLNMPTALTPGADGRFLYVVSAGDKALRVFEVEPNQQSCSGDCDDDGAVGIDELVQAVRIALDLQMLEVCRAIDSDGDGRVTIAELIAAVRGALIGCEPRVR